MFKGKTALVTGAAGGLGSAIAIELARHGANISMADVQDQTKTHEAVVAQGVKAISHHVDLTSVDAIRKWVQTSHDKLGSLDILVTGAGVVGFGNAESITEAEWSRIVDVNMKAVFFCCQAALPFMKQQQSGRIINVGSVLAKNGGNPRPWINPAEQEKASSVVYGMSKAGVHAMTLFLAKELAGHGINVNAIAPGPIASEMTREFPDTLKQLIPLQRMGSASDVAGAVRFLASDDASFITGEILDINGGLWVD